MGLIYIYMIYDIYIVYIYIIYYIYIYIILYTVYKLVIIWIYPKKTLVILIYSFSFKRCVSLAETIP